MALPVVLAREPGSGLLRDRVDIWRTDLDVHPRHHLELAGLLADDDLRRSRRFRSDLERDRFVVRRAFLRAVLGRYLEREPRSVEIDRPTGRKPVSRDEPRLQFSLSASGPVALLAVADTEVGVDVEIVRGEADVESIAQRWLSTRERASMDGLGDWDRRRAVFECLTRKEAVLKAAGVGFAVSPDRIEVAATNEMPVRATVPSATPTTWWVHHLHPAPHPERDSVGALATAEREPTVSFHDWNDGNAS